MSNYFDIFSKFQWGFRQSLNALLPDVYDWKMEKVKEGILLLSLLTSPKLSVFPHMTSSMQNLTF